MNKLIELTEEKIASGLMVDIDQEKEVLSIMIEHRQELCDGLMHDRIHELIQL